MSSNNLWNQHAKEGHTRFTIEASTLGDQPTICPNCNKAVSQMEPKKGFSGELEFWQAVCPCGVELVVFND